MKFFLFVFINIFGLMNLSHAEMKAYRIQSADDRIALDGKLNEDVWKKIVAHDQFYQTQPIDKVAAHVRTEVKVAYDDQYLYVAIKAFDPEMTLIRAPFARRDKLSNDQDYVGLYIDSSSAHNSAQFFYVNARGAVMDGVFSNTSGEDVAPDYDFDAVTELQDDGWSAEFRIPFNAIAYDQTSSTPWSLMVFRNMTRDQRYRMYSGEVTRATSCNLCFSNAIENLNQLPSTSSWQFTPQLVLRRAKDKVDGNISRQENGSELSLDMKFRPNSATTIDATLNPDFSQIELDAPQLSGNTKFSIFVQEKRPFFLEGADIFNTQMNVISTRSISNPDMGLRYTVRDANQDFSVLSTKDAAGGLVLIPNAYYTAYATRTVPSIATDARANFRFGSMTLGAVLTDRTLQQNGGYNRVMGTDFSWQVDQNQSMRAQVLMSATTSQADAKGNLVRAAMTNGHAAAFDWSNGNDVWSSSVNLRDISSDFRADNGFFPQVGYTDLNVNISKKYRRVAIFNELFLGLNNEYKWDSEGNKLYQNWTASVTANGPYDSQASIKLTPQNKTRISEGGELFSTNKVNLTLSISPSKEIAKIAGDVTLGDVIDVAANRVGKGGVLSLSAKLRPWDRLEIEPSYASSWINSQNVQSGNKNEQAYKETALQLNSIYHFSAKDNVRLIVQEAQTTRNPLLYVHHIAPKSTRSVRSLVYTHTQKLGTAMYIGFTATKSDTPNFAKNYQQNELFAKFSWRI